MCISRAPAKKPSVKKTVTGKNTKSSVDAINKPIGWNKFWNTNLGWNAVIAIIALFAFILSVLNYISQAKQDIKQEEQYIETKNELKLEKLKNSAREWFAQGDFKVAAKCYNQVYEKDPDDDEGYRKFYGKGKDLLATAKGKCNSDIIWFFEQAKKLTKDTNDIDKELELCNYQ